jgi:hypothetical protein
VPAHAQGKKESRRQRQYWKLMYFVARKCVNARVACNTKLTMQKLLTTFLLCFILTNAFGQKDRSSSLYFEGQYNQTISDVTEGNNPWGMGLGLQMFFRQKSIFRPTAELTADGYLMDDKVYRMYSDGTPIRTVGGMINVFAGASVHPLKNAYVSFVVGPSFIGGQALLGLKPSVGFYFSANQKVTGKISYINVLNRETRAKQNFTSISFALGVKLH